MKKAYSMIRDAVKRYPLLLSSMPDSLVKVADKMLPYSTGIEIECSQSPSFYAYDFAAIPGVLHYDFDTTEQRIRIDKGVTGMKALWNVCQLLKYESLLNSSSGIHYHIDMTDLYGVPSSESADDYSRQMQDLVKHANWVLKSLDSWKYTGSYNTRTLSCSKCSWVKIDMWKRTLEFRIGEMTFDYAVIMKRILHAQNIVRRIKELERAPSKKIFKLRDRLHGEIRDPRMAPDGTYGPPLQSRQQRHLNS